MESNYCISDIDEISFIEKVKEFPAIYDDRHVSYTNRNKREQIWQQIGESFGYSAVVCKKKWEILRGNFRRSHKIEKSGLRKKQWRNYKRMTFLLPYITNKNGKDEQGEEFEPEDPTRDPLMTPKLEPETSRDSSEFVTVEAATAIPKIASGSDENDKNPNMQFFTSMAMTVNTFPTEHQVRIKMMLLQQVSEVQLLLENLQPIEYPANPFLSEDSNS